MRHFHATKLAGTTGLFFMGVINVNFFGQGFPVSHLWGTNVGFNLEFALHAINQNIKV